MQRRWFVGLFVLILLGWAAVGAGFFRAHRDRTQAEGARRPLTARTTGTVVSLDSLEFSRGEFYYRARVAFATPTGRRVEATTERKGWPPALGDVWRRDLRVGGPVAMCFAPSDPAQNAADVYATASPCPAP